MGRSTTRWLEPEVMVWAGVQMCGVSPCEALAGWLFFVKQNAACEFTIGDCSADVCTSDEVWCGELRCGVFWCGVVWCAGVPCRLAGWLADWLAESHAP